jgi:hypothetical protein
VLEPPFDVNAQPKPRRAPSIRAKKEALRVMKVAAQRDPLRPPGGSKREYLRLLQRQFNKRGIRGLTYRLFEEECWPEILKMPSVKWGGDKGKGGRPKSAP